MAIEKLKFPEVFTDDEKSKILRVTNDQPRKEKPLNCWHLLLCLLLPLMVWKYFQGETAEVFPGIIARNQKTIEYDRFIHKTFYPYIIHPHSKFRVYWEIGVLIFWPIFIFIHIFIWGFLLYKTPYRNITNYILSLFYLIDCILLFFTGYVEEETEVVVLRPKDIAQKYVRGTFFLDFLAIFPYEVIEPSNLPECYNPKYIQEWYCVVLHFAFMLSYFIKIGTYIKYMKNVARVTFWNPFTFNMCVFCIIILVIVYVHLTFFFITYEMFQSMYPNADRNFETGFLKFVTAFLDILFEILFTYRVELGWESLIQFPTLLSTFILNLLITAFIIKYFRFKMKANRKDSALENAAQLFVKKRQLPVSLKQKIILYFQVFLANKYRKEDEIIKFFPGTFKSDIFSHRCVPLLRGFQAFEDLPMHVLRMLVDSLKYQLYLPNQTVMKNETKLSLYFVLNGTVALFTVNNTELYHFEGGSSFNGRYFLEGRSSPNHYAISLEVTEIYSLDHDTFKNIMSNFPPLMQKINEKFVTSENHDLID